MSVAGIIFSNLHDKEVFELTRVRTMASIPFACRYRLIDFTLSNMVNSGITDINVIVHYNYHSLMDHIGSGKDWDLARRSGGIKILPPYITAYANNINSLYHTRLEALISVNYSISNINSDYILLSDCNIICNIDLKEVLNEHIQSNADVTIVTKNEDITNNKQRLSVFQANENNDITDIAVNPTVMTGRHEVGLNIMVVNTKYLLSSIKNAISHNYTSFNYDILARNMGRDRFKIYKYNGYYAHISSFSDYFTASMDIINNQNSRDALLNVKNRPIYTKIRNSAPTKYTNTSVIKNSIIADGCTIEGSVENTILFRGVKIGKNTFVKNSILFQDTYVSENVHLNCVVTDKNSIIRDGRILSGHETLPYYIDKGKMI